LELRPLIAFRDYHSTTHENDAINRGYDELMGSVKLTPYAGMPVLYLAHNAASVASQGHWYKHFEFYRERERGLDWEEDLFNPCALAFDLARSPVATVIASTELRSAADAAQLEQKERSRRKTVAAAAPLEDEFTRTLSLAADQFIVKRSEQHTVIAGYPWFGDWGRDTMIALPGLTLLTGRAEIARSVLLEFSKHLSQGMLPNRFPDSGEVPEYNNVDGTLWYFEAIRAYHTHTGDYALVTRLYPLLCDIIDWHLKGTRYRIFVEQATGLLHAGEPGVQLTWMDAKVGDWVVTPRIGKPVEIQALWYNALRTMEGFAAMQGDQPAGKRFGQMAGQAQSSFNQIFWNAKENCLYDVVDDVPDASIRPNQVLAVSLPHSMLASDRARAVVNKVETELLTPVGLRTLAASDPKYVGTYGGDQRSRDGAYHQGTVWPWLLGPFIRSYLAVNTHSAAACDQARKWLQPLAERLSEGGLGTVPEIFDGDPPHRPAGCIAQAWSVAEILRAWVEVAQPAVASTAGSARAASRK
jgi:predicted glycogen debranching enzyme